MPMRIVHTYIKNMGIKNGDESLFTFADRWGLVSQAKLGHEVTLLCGGEGKERTEYVWKGVRVIELPAFFQFSSSTRLLKGFVRELRNIEADVFHTHHYCSFLPELTALVGKLRKIPVFVTLHSSFTGQSGVIGFFERLYGVFMQPFLPFFNGILFISTFIKDSKFFSIVPKKKKHITYNYFIEPPSISAEKESNTILFIGRVTYLKGLDVLLRALALVRQKIPSVKLHVVGDGSVSYKTKLMSIIAQYHLEDSVLFHGAIHDERKWSYFAKSMMQVIPSRGEGFGNVVIEGMLCGLPVLVSNRGALEEAGGGHSLVFNINDKKDLAEKIIRLLKDEALCKRMGQEGKAYAQRFTKEIIGEQTIAYYNEALR